MSSRCNRVQRGFTLVELLVVIGIIAVLIAILMPALSRARVHAQSIQCSSQLRQVGVWLQMYELEWRGAIIPSFVKPNLSWMQHLIFNTNYTDKFDTRVRMLQCPSRSDSINISSAQLHYAMNCFINPYNPPPQAPFTPNLPEHEYWPKITKIHMTAAMLYLADTPTWYLLSPDGNLGGSVPAFIHANRANALFLDGHCESMTVDDLCTPALKWAAANPGIWYLYQIPPWHGGGAADKRYVGW